MQGFVCSGLCCPLFLKYFRYGVLHEVSTRLFAKVGNKVYFNNETRCGKRGHADCGT
jgi:hypothetical protein